MNNAEYLLRSSSNLSGFPLGKRMLRAHKKGAAGKASNPLYCVPQMVQELSSLHLVLEEYVSDEHLFTHTLELHYPDEVPVELFLIDGQQCPMGTWLAQLQHARRNQAQSLLNVQQSKLKLRAGECW